MGQGKMFGAFERYLSLGALAEIAGNVLQQKMDATGDPEAAGALVRGKQKVLKYLE